MTKEDLELLQEIKLMLKRKNSKNDYYKQTEYLVDGKHAGWQTLIEGINGDDDWLLIIGDEEHDLLDVEHNTENEIVTLVPKDKEALKSIITNIKNEREPIEQLEPPPYSGPIKDHDAILNKPIKAPTPIETHVETEREQAERIRKIALAIERDFPDTTEYSW